MTAFFCSAAVCCLFRMDRGPQALKNFMPFMLLNLAINICNHFLNTGKEVTTPAKRHTRAEVYILFKCLKQCATNSAAPGPRCASAG